MTQINEFLLVSENDLVRLEFKDDGDAAVQRWVSFRVAEVVGQGDQMRLVAGDGEVFWSADWSLVHAIEQRKV